MGYGWRIWRGDWHRHCPARKKTGQRVRDAALARSTAMIDVQMLSQAERNGSKDTTHVNRAVRPHLKNDDATRLWRDEADGGRSGLWLHITPLHPPRKRGTQYAAGRPPIIRSLEIRDHRGAVSARRRSDPVAGR